MRQSLHLQFDGSFDGLLSAVFYSFAEKLPPETLHLHDGRAHSDLFARNIVVPTQAEHAARVFRRLEQQVGARHMWRFLYGYLSAEAAMPDTFLRLVHLALAHPRRNILRDLGHPDVVQWQQWGHAVGREKHHMEAFVRFEAYEEALYFARIAPRYDLLALIAPHFAARYPQMRWGIYDSSRGYGIYHEQGQLSLLDGLDEAARKSAQSREEADWQRLWRQYFRSTTIDSRRNLRQQAQQMPRRYWKYLSETAPVNDPPPAAPPRRQKG